VNNRQTQEADYRKTLRAGAELLLDSADATADTEGLYADAEFVHFSGNQRFFADASYPRRFESLNREIQQGLTAIGVVKQPALAQADWDYSTLR